MTVHRQRQVDLTHRGRKLQIGIGGYLRPVTLLREEHSAAYKFGPRLIVEAHLGWIDTRGVRSQAELEAAATARFDERFPCRCGGKGWVPVTIRSDEGHDVGAMEQCPCDAGAAWAAAIAECPECGAVMSIDEVGASCKACRDAEVGAEKIWRDPETGDETLIPVDEWLDAAELSGYGHQLWRSRWSAGA